MPRWILADGKTRYEVVIAGSIGVFVLVSLASSYHWDVAIGMTMDVCEVVVETAGRIEGRHDPDRDALSPLRLSSSLKRPRP